jgi:HK97 family phage major capsid protein
MEKRLQEIFNDLQKLNERKAAIDTELRSGNEGLDLEALDKEVDGINDNINQLVEEQRSIENKLNIAKKINDGSTNEFRTLAKPKQEERQMDNILASMEYRQAFMNHVLRGSQIPSEYRANTLTTDIGAMIPETVMNLIIEKLEATGMILPLITRTSLKGGVTYPTSSVKPVASWVAEGAGSALQKKTTGQITFAYHKLRCAVSVSLEVDNIALAAFETALINNVVEAMVKAVEQAIISGDGIGKPKGIITETPAEGQSIEVATATGPKISDLENAEAALPIEYEGNARWVMTKKTFMKYSTVKGTDGHPIARTNYGIDGKPERVFLGRSVVINNYLPSWETASAGDVFAFIFNFKDYALNTNYAMGIKKYEDNETDDQVTKAIMVVDGKVLDVNSLVVLKKA